MKVRKLIAMLQKMPQNVEVHINDEMAGKLHEIIDGIHFYRGDPDYGDKPAVVITINEV